MVTSGCCSSSGLLEALLCRLTFECLGSSSSSKLLNSGSLEMKKRKCRISCVSAAISRMTVTTQRDLLFRVADSEEVKLFDHGSGYQGLEWGREKVRDPSVQATPTHPHTPYCKCVRLRERVDSKIHVRLFSNFLNEHLKIRWVSTYSKTA